MRIGIDLGGTKIEALALDDSGRELARLRVATPTTSYTAVIDALVDVVRAVEQQVGGPATHVGMGIPGTISPATGLVKNANTNVLIGHPLDRDLAERLGRPVRVANDANCFALSEATDGAGAHLEPSDRPFVVFGVIIGTGTGAGVVVDRRVLQGPAGIAGEWGHNPLPWARDDEWPAPPCWCGRTGCLELYLSGPGLARDYQRRSGQVATAPAIAAAAADGDALAAETLARYEDRLARGLATIINVLDPDVIVLGGGVSNIARLYDNVPRLWSQYVFSDKVETRLHRARHGDASGVRGAAWLWPV